MRKVTCPANNYPWSVRACWSTAAIAAATIAWLPAPSLADEGGVSFWLPGQFGSLAALPGQPGFAFAAIYYHTTVDADRGKNFRIGGGVQAGLHARADLALLNATYIAATPVLGGQASFGVTGIVGRNNVGVDAVLSGPLGNSLSGTRSDTTTGIGDLYPMATVKWNMGVHNTMVYMTGDIPVGSYSANRLANLGIGHGAIDGGAGYTYFNPATGHEFSVVGGLTYNFKNQDTDYQNGIDAHIDWGASQFLSKQVLVGLVGYFYQQLTADSGSGATLGPFKSRVAGIGPQFGYLFPVGGMQGYLNVKGYYEFAAENRPEGWNAWLTLSISPAAPAPATMQTKLIRK
jgi:hypothetical protein